MTRVWESPRLALWLSIITGAILVIGLSYAVATQPERKEPGGAPTDVVVNALAGMEQLGD